MGLRVRKVRPRLVFDVRRDQKTTAGESSEETWPGGGDREGELNSWTLKDEFTFRCSSTEGREAGEVVSLLLV